MYALRRDEPVDWVGKKEEDVDMVAAVSGGGTRGARRGRAREFPFTSERIKHSERKAAKEKYRFSLWIAKRGRASRAFVQTMFRQRNCWQDSFIYCLLVPRLCTSRSIQNLNIRSETEELSSTKVAASFFLLTQAAISALFRLTKWGKKPSPIAGISWRSYLLRVVPPGIANAIDINVAIPHPSIPDNCTNLSKSGAPFLVLLMTYSFHLETPTVKLTASVTSFTIGTLLIVGKVLGQKIPLSRFALYTAASVVTALRWTGTQILLQREIVHMSTPFSTMRVMKPVAAVITLSTSYFTESWDTLGEDSLLDTKLNIFLTTLVAAGGLVLSTIKSVAELMLLVRTSALTYILLLLLKDVHHILEEMVHAGWSSFFERRGAAGGSLTQETIGFPYQQWSVRGLRRSMLVTMDEIQKENELHIQ